MNRTAFIRLLSEEDKQGSLLREITAYRSGALGEKTREVSFSVFDALPGKAFAYWLSDDAIRYFSDLPRLGSEGRVLKQGLATADDFRFIRCWWEPEPGVLLNGSQKWYPFVKGVENKIAYSETKLRVNWRQSGVEIKNNLNAKGIPRSNVWMLKETEANYFFRPGLAWPSRPHGKGFFSIVPRGCLFSHTSTMLFSNNQEIWEVCAIVNSAPYSFLLHALMPRGGGTSGQTYQYEVGYVSSIPVPHKINSFDLKALSMRAWLLGYLKASADETSHAFVLPAQLIAHVLEHQLSDIELELAEIQNAIDASAFELYEFNATDRAAALGQPTARDDPEGETQDDVVDCEEEDEAQAVNQIDGLLSWAVGVAFGRFDWRLATGEREAPPKPDPFDPLPAKSPGMLPDGAAPFHDNSGILVDDQGHPHDVPRLIEEVLTRVQTDVPADVRRWLQRDFFPLHLKQYSKSRRKAPIYWPLSTTSGSYTLWLYYPSLTSQTLYTAVNDFVEPKLKQVSRDAATLRDKGAARTRDDEKAFEALQALELELIELRDTLLGIAPTYRPNHDDGVQITAAPLWPLFRHKPWQKVLKDTWAKLEKGDYDWAHLAMVYWPDRVREKCKTDKSLAIARDLEDLYEPVPSTEGGKKKKKGSRA
jgi:hypothetical protein